MVALSTALEDNSRDSSGWTYWQNTVKEQANLELTMSCMSSMWQMQSLTQVFTTCESWIRTMGWRNWNSRSNPVTKVDAYDVDEDSGLTCMAHSPHFILFSHRRSHKLYKLWTPPPTSVCPIQYVYVRIRMQSQKKHTLLQIVCFSIIS